MTFMRLTLLIFQCIFAVATIATSDSDGENLQIAVLSDQKLNRFSYVSTHYEPFIYRNENGKYDGIEYRLVKIFAEKEHLKLKIGFGNRSDGPSFDALFTYK